MAIVPTGADTCDVAEAEDDLRLAGADGTEIEAVWWIHEGKRVRRWIEKENALLGRLAKDAPQVSWVADGERERALAEFWMRSQPTPMTVTGRAASGCTDAGSDGRSSSKSDELGRTAAALRRQLPALQIRVSWVRDSLSWWREHRRQVETKDHPAAAPWPETAAYTPSVWFSSRGLTLVVGVLC